MEIVAESFASAYYQIRERLLQAPEISPRGMKTREILGVTINIKNIRSRLWYHPERHYSLPLYVAESIMLFSDSDRVEHFSYISPQLLNYSDDARRLYGSYGNRIHDSLRDIFLKFEKDIDTRQAVLTIARPYDLRVVTKDQPCNVMLHLLHRNGKLNLFVFARSIDAWWGLQYDTGVFCTFLEIIANTLNLEVGELYYSISSLHVYEPFYKEMEKINQVEPIEFKLDYTIEDMPRLIDLVKQLRFLQDESIFGDTGFDYILQSLWRKKHHLYYKPMPITEFSFADQFLQYEVKEERKSA